MRALNKDELFEVLIIMQVDGLRLEEAMALVLDANRMKTS
jgi:hypothetical protein